MEEYNPVPVNVEPSARVSAIIPRIENNNVVIVLGAGVSMGPPASLPSGIELAQRVKPRLQGGALAKAVESANEDSLLDIADAIQTNSPEAFPLFVNTILQMADFKTAIPNFGHLALALLMAETNIQILSTNWDTCIERCSPIVLTDIVACFDHNGLQNIGGNNTLLKLHGCARHESSILISSKQMAEGTWWADHQVGAALGTSLVVFLGIGSIAEYIRMTLEGIISKTQNLDNIVVVDPTLSADWNGLIAGGVKNYLAMRSEEFLDDVIRSLTLSVMSKVNVLAKEMDTELPRPDIHVAQTMIEISDFLGKYPAFLIWLWARRGFFSRDQSPCVLDSTFQQFILALALIQSVFPLLEMDMIGNTSFIRCKDFVVEIAWARDPSVSLTLINKKIKSIREDKRKNLLPQTQRFIILAHGFVGGLPARTMKESVIDPPNIKDIIDGSDALGARWISVSELIQAKDTNYITELLVGS